MPALKWISDANLDECINKFILGTDAAVKKAEIKMNNNVIDPFSTVSIASKFNIGNIDNLKQILIEGASLRAMDNPLGKFHQNILGSIRGWTNWDAGYDVVNDSKKILAEIKNKHNTLNATGRSKTESDLATAIQQKGGKKSGWTGYLVLIVPKNRKRYIKELVTKQPCYEIDGASFYTLATGHDSALRDLFNVLIQKFQKKRQSIPHDIQDYCWNAFNNAFDNDE